MHRLKIKIAIYNFFFFLSKQYTILNLNNVAVKKILKLKLSMKIKLKMFKQVTAHNFSFFGRSNCMLNGIEDTLNLLETSSKFVKIQKNNRPENLNILKGGVYCISKEEARFNYREKKPKQLFKRMIGTCRGNRLSAGNFSSPKT